MHEVELLASYSEYTVARKVLEEHLEARPEDKIARLRLTCLALQQGWEDLVERDLSQLPKVEELANAFIGGTVADILRSGPDPTQAVDYAYDLYRRFPDQAASHRALIASVLAPGPEGLDIETPETVKPGTAVCYREVGRDESRWLVVEDAEDPCLSRHEYASTQGLVPAMLGKSVGDEFPLSQASIRERRGIITEIKDKCIYRMQDSMLGYTERFPDEWFFEPIPVKDSDSPSEYDFSELIKTLEKLDEPLERLESMYREGRIPISSLARFTRKSVFETVYRLAFSPDLGVHACAGSQNDLDEASTVLDSLTVVVLDPTAVATLALLGEVPSLGALPFQCVVTEATLQELRSLIREDSPSRGRGRMGARHGHGWIAEANEDEEAEWHEQLREVIRNLETHCEVIGGRDLAHVEFSLRQELVKVAASGSVQALAAASIRPGSALWTDDHLFYRVSRDLLPTPRVWTQSLFIWGDGKGIIERARRSRVAARMLRLGYSFTSSNSVTVLDTCEAAAWLPEEPDLAAVLADFGNPAWEYSVALRFTTETIVKVWREAPAQAHAQEVTRRLLSHLRNREDCARIVLYLLENVDSLLGLALTRTDALRRMLQLFLQAGVPAL